MIPRVMRPVAAVVVFASALAWPVSGQMPVSPVFRAGVDLVTFDVRVLDRQGRPIPGLRLEEFQVELDGARRPVQAVEYIEFATARTPAPVRPPAERSPFQSAAATDDAGRSILIAFDDLSFRSLQGNALLADVGRWLARLDPRDQVGIATTSGLGPPVTWSTDRTSTLQAMRLLTGRRDRVPRGPLRVVLTIEEARAFRECNLEFRDVEGVSRPFLESCGVVPPSVLNRECPPDADDQLGCANALVIEARLIRAEAEREAELQLGGLTGILAALARVPPPRVLLVISRGVPLAFDRAFDLTPLALAAAHAGTSVFALTTPGSVSDSELPPKMSKVGLMPEDAQRKDDAFTLAGIESVAGVTGGLAHVAAGSADAFLDRALVETSGYYRLGVEPPAGGRDWMYLKVTTRRAGASISTADRVPRPGAPPEAVASAPASVDDQLAGLLTRGGLRQGMLVELTTLVGREPSGQRLQIVANARLREDRPGPLKGMYALVAVGGAIVSSGSLTMVERRDQSGFRAAFHVPVLPGRYQLRFAVADASGQFGAAQQEVSARLKQIGSYYVSDLVLAWAGADNKLQYPELDELPSTAVTFRPILELYAASAEPTAVPRVRVVVEPAGGGPALLEKDMATVVGGTVARARTDVPVRSLPPGEYAVHAVVFEGSREAGRVSATLRVTPPVDRERVRQDRTGT